MFGKKDSADGAVAERGSEQASTAENAAVSEFPKKGSNGSGTTNAYSVEARYMFHTPKQFGDQIFDQRWQRISFSLAKIGVPVGPMYDYGPRACGLLGYSAAQALRWWFHANADAEMLGGLCLETRVIKHRVTYSYGEEAVSEHEFIGGDDRSNCMPDWGNATTQSQRDSND